MSPRLHRAQNVMLLCASYIFYGAWDHRFLFLVFFSTAVDYICGLGISGRRLSRGSAAFLAFMMVLCAVGLLAPVNWLGLYASTLPRDITDAGWIQTSSGFVADDWAKVGGALAMCAAYGLAFSGGFLLAPERRRKYFLVVSIGTNLLLLGFFKYFDFFVGSASDLLEQIGFGRHEWQIGIIVPVGISFYTFQTMSYAIDVYRNEMDADRRPRRLRALRHVFSAARGRTDRARAQPAVATPAPSAAAVARHPGGHIPGRLGAVQEAVHRRQRLALRPSGVHGPSRRVRAADRDGVICVRHPDLLRLQRVQRHRPRSRAA